MKKRQIKKKRTTRKKTLPVDRSINIHEMKQKISVLDRMEEEMVENMKKKIIIILVIIGVLLLTLFSIMLSRKIQKQPIGVNVITNMIPYKIKANDTLWDISKIYYSNYSEWPVIYFNNVSNISFPDLIIINEKIVIPMFNKQTNFNSNLGDMYFDLYRMYRKIGWKKHAEGMLYMSTKVYSNKGKLNGTVDDIDFQRDMERLKNGKDF